MNQCTIFSCYYCLRDLTLFAICYYYTIYLPPLGSHTRSHSIPLLCLFYLNPLSLPTFLSSYFLLFFSSLHHSLSSLPSLEIFYTFLSRSYRDPGSFCQRVADSHLSKHLNHVLTISLPASSRRSGFQISPSKPWHVFPSSGYFSLPG